VAFPVRHLNRPLKWPLIALRANEQPL
jgi:hypothetical protein